MARVLCLFSHITHVITLIRPGPRFVGLPIVGVFAHNNDWPGHQGWGSCTPITYHSQPAGYRFIFLSISQFSMFHSKIWRQPKLSQSCDPAPGEPRWLRLRLWLLVTYYYQNGISMFPPALFSPSVVTLANFSIIYIIIVTQSWCWNNFKLLTECINNEHGYEKNTNYVNWNGSVLYSIKV